MKIIIIQLLLFTQCVGVLFAQNVPFYPLTEKETVEVAQKLESFDKGSATLDSLTDSQEWTMRILEYYVTHTNEVTIKMKLPIAKSYAVWSKYPEAAELAQDYVNVYSNDWHGWRVLGGCKLAMKSYDEAVDDIMNAARLGDKKNYVGLGLAAVAANRSDILKNIVVPNLLVQMNDTKDFPEKQRNQMRGLIIYDAINADNKGMFIKAIVGLDISKISQWEELKDIIAQGCDHFKGADIDKSRKELEAATESNSSSTATNVPPKQN